MCVCERERERESECERDSVCVCVRPCVCVYVCECVCTCAFFLFSFFRVLVCLSQRQSERVKFSNLIFTIQHHRRKITNLCTYSLNEMQGALWYTLSTKPHEAGRRDCRAFSIGRICTICAAADFCRTSMHTCNARMHVCMHARTHTRCSVL